MKISPFHVVVLCLMLASCGGPFEPASPDQAAQGDAVFVCSKQFKPKTKKFTACVNQRTAGYLPVEQAQYNQIIQNQEMRRQLLLQQDQMQQLSDQQNQLQTQLDEMKIQHP